MNKFPSQEARTGETLSTQGQDWLLPDGVEESIDVLARATATIDELIERNRTITDAAVRSVEHFRIKAREAETERLRLQEEIEALRAERDVLRAEREAMRVAADALRADCEAEIEVQRREIERTQATLHRFNTQVADLLGAAERNLAETADSLPTI